MTSEGRAKAELEEAKEIWKELDKQAEESKALWDEDSEGNYRLKEEIAEHMPTIKAPQIMTTTGLKKIKLDKKKEKKEKKEK